MRKSFLGFNKEIENLNNPNKSLKPCFPQKKKHSKNKKSIIYKKINYDINELKNIEEEDIIDRLQQIGLDINNFETTKDIIKTNNNNNNKNKNDNKNFKCIIISGTSYVFMEKYIYKRINRRCIMFE